MNENIIYVRYTALSCTYLPRNCNVTRSKDEGGYAEALKLALFIKDSTIRCCLFFAMFRKPAPLSFCRLFCDVMKVWKVPGMGFPALVWELQPG